MKRDNDCWQNKTLYLVFFNNKQEWSTDTWYIMDEHQKYNAKWKTTGLIWYNMISFTELCRISKSTGTENTDDCQGLGGRRRWEKMGEWLSMDGFLIRVIKIFQNCGDRYSILWIHKNHWMAHFQQWIACVWIIFKESSYFKKDHLWTLKLPGRKCLNAMDIFQAHSRLYVDFPGGPVAKTLCSQCRSLAFNPWLGN